MQSIIGIGIFFHYIALGVLLAKLRIKGTLRKFVLVFVYMVISHLILGLILAARPNLFTPE